MIRSRHTLTRLPLPRLTSTLVLSFTRNSNLIKQQLEQQRRTFFGIGEILGVITNPGEVLRSLTESRKLLAEAREEIKSASEKSQIPPSHTFSPLPGFYSRPSELLALEKTLAGVPKFTVLFGASSVGKTALLREVLSRSDYAVLSFDLRISGVGDLESVWFGFCGQMERYFASLPELMGSEWGWDQFEKESWAFKHDRIAMEKRIEAGHPVKTADISRLMELFQSALLKYWEFQPMSSSDRKLLVESQKSLKQQSKSSSSKSKDEAQIRNRNIKKSHDITEVIMREGSVGGDVGRGESLMEARTVGENEEGEGGKGEKEKPPPKKIPVFFLDEAHKLPALIQDPDAMKAILDAMLVLTKQDRLCHVVHCTSDSFYQAWLRQFNIAQHCTILTIGDCSKSEARNFFEKDLLTHVPDHLKKLLKFEEIYKVFGGKLAHLSDYTTEFINAEGNLTPQQSSHFLQAYSLLNLQFIHSMSANSSNPNFNIHSSLYNAPLPSSNSSLSDPPSEPENFTAKDLLTVMKRLSSTSSSSTSTASSSIDQNYKSLPYFPLCRELGVHQVDSLIRAKVIELRWSPTITREGDDKLIVGNVEEEKQGESRFGPVVVPTTRVVGYAMGIVVKELEEAKARVVKNGVYQ